MQGQAQGQTPGGCPSGHLQSFTDLGAGGRDGASPLLIPLPDPLNLPTSLSNSPEERVVLNAHLPQPLG